MIERKKGEEQFFDRQGGMTQFKCRVSKRGEIPEWYSGVRAESCETRGGMRCLQRKGLS